MRHIDFEAVVGAVRDLCESTCHELGGDVLAALRAARRTESNPRAAGIIDQLLENARIASESKIPLCQDTGLAVLFVEQGDGMRVKCPSGRTLADALNAGVAAGYEHGYLRKSVVAEPLFERKNTGTNTPAIIHYSPVAGDRLKITLMAKGGGCENKSRFRMFRPTAGKDEVVEWVVDVVRAAGADACPPLVVGVGIGGDFELCCLLSKKALLRPLGAGHPEAFYAALEN